MPDDGQFSIRDLGSRNGTLVNGVPVEQQQIRHGDQIYIGDSVLVFLLEEGGNHFDRNPVEFADTVGIRRRSGCASRPKIRFTCGPRKNRQLARIAPAGLAT